MGDYSGCMKDDIRALPRPRLGIFGTGRMGRVHLSTWCVLHPAASTSWRWRCLDPGCGARVSVDADARSGPRLATASTAAEWRGPHDGVVIASHGGPRARHRRVRARGIPCWSRSRWRARSPRRRHHRRLATAPTGWCRWRFSVTMTPRRGRRMVEQGAIGSIQQSEHVLQAKNPTPPACRAAASPPIWRSPDDEALSLRGFTLRGASGARYFSPPYDDRAREGANIVHGSASGRTDRWPNGDRASADRLRQPLHAAGTEGRIDVGEFAGDFGPIVAKLGAELATDLPARHARRCAFR